jgi:CRISPR-associated protein Csb2
VSTVLSLRFPAGRYHATRWGSHANEADIEWPPSPWRILRALVATWHRKVSPTRFPEDVLATLIEQLSASDPVFRLPRIVAAHSRHYMPVRTGAADRPVLVFDSFARIDPGDELIVAWPDVMPGDRERNLFATLVDLIGFLGRAESWVDARLLDKYDAEFNCGPSDSAFVPQPSMHVPVRLLGPLTAETYAERRSRAIAELGLNARRLTAAQRRTLATLPPRLLDALRVETGDLRSAGWNLPPGGRMVTYERPRLDTASMSPRRRGTGRPDRITTVRLALAGRPLPRIEDAVRIGELARDAAISAADRIENEGGVPTEISGHGSGEDLNHRHAFYLPEDADGDGFIDHVLIHAPGGLSHRAVLALDELHRRGLWTQDGERWVVVFEGAWETPTASRSCYGHVSRTWVSVTPYLHPWYAKKGFGVTEQLCRECKQRGLPAPLAVTVLSSIRVAGRERRPVHFHRFRSKRGLRQPDSRGSMLEIAFAEPLAGPLALGFGCHFGLGMFASLSPR